MISDIESAALHNLLGQHPALNSGPSALSFELGLHTATEAALNTQQSLINRVRAAVQQIPETETRSAYEKWLDFYQRENDEARTEMVSGVRRHAWLKFKEQRRAENAAIERRAETLPLPC